VDAMVQRSPPSTKETVLRQQPMRDDDTAGCLDTGGDDGRDTKLKVVTGQREVAIGCSGEQRTSEHFMRAAITDRT